MRLSYLSFLGTAFAALADDTYTGVTGDSALTNSFLPLNPPNDAHVILDQLTEYAKASAVKNDISGSLQIDRPSIFSQAIALTPSQLTADLELQQQFAAHQWPITCSPQRWYDAIHVGIPESVHDAFDWAVSRGGAPSIESYQVAIQAIYRIWASQQAAREKELAEGVNMVVGWPPHGGCVSKTETMSSSVAMATASSTVSDPKMAALDSILSAIVDLLSVIKSLLPSLSQFIDSIIVKIAQLQNILSPTSSIPSVPSSTVASGNYSFTLTSSAVHVSLAPVVKRDTVDDVKSDVKALISNLEILSQQIIATAPLSSETQDSLNKLLDLIQQLRDWLGESVATVTPTGSLSGTVSVFPRPSETVKPTVKPTDISVTSVILSGSPSESSVTPTKSGTVSIFPSASSTKASIITTFVSGVWTTVTVTDTDCDTTTTVTTCDEACQSKSATTMTTTVCDESCQSAKSTSSCKGVCSVTYTVSETDCETDTVKPTNSPGKDTENKPGSTGSDKDTENKPNGSGSDSDKDTNGSTGSASGSDNGSKPEGSKPEGSTGGSSESDNGSDNGSNPQSKPNGSTESGANSDSNPSVKPESGNGSPNTQSGSTKPESGNTESGSTGSTGSGSTGSGSTESEGPNGSVKPESGSTSPESNTGSTGSTEGSTGSTESEGSTEGSTGSTGPQSSPNAGSENTPQSSPEGSTSPESGSEGSTESGPSDSQSGDESGESGESSDESNDSSPHPTSNFPAQLPSAEHAAQANSASKLTIGAAMAIPLAIVLLV